MVHPRSITRSTLERLPRSAVLGGVALASAIILAVVAMRVLPVLVPRQVLQYSPWATLALQAAMSLERNGGTGCEALTRWIGSTDETRCARVAGLACAGADVDARILALRAVVAGGALTRAPYLLPRLIALFADPDWRIRLAVVEQVGYFRDPRVAAALFAALHETEARIAVRAAQPWGLQHPPLEDIRRAAADDLPLVRMAALGALIGRTGTEAHAIVSHALDDEVTRRSAISMLAAFPAGEDEDALIRCVDPRHDEWETAAAAAALARYRSPAARQALARLHASPGAVAHTRFAAISALAAIGDPQDAPVFTAALSDRVADIRLSAVRALDAVGGSSGCAALEGLSSDPDPRVAQAVASALARARVEHRE